MVPIEQKGYYNQITASYQSGSLDQGRVSLYEYYRKNSNEFLRSAGILKKYKHEHLIPLLNPEIEDRLFSCMEFALEKALNEKNPSSQPINRDPNEARDIRRKVFEYLKEYEEKGVLPKGILPHIRVIPPEKMFGLNAPGEGPEWVMTMYGEAIHALKKKWPDLIILFYAGRASESNDVKPKDRQREVTSERALRTTSLKELIPVEEDIKVLAASKMCDFDFLIVSPTGGPDEKEIASFLNANKNVFKVEEGAFVRYYDSQRRKFKGVAAGVIPRPYVDEMENTKTTKEVITAQWFYPGWGVDYYGAENRLLPFLMWYEDTNIPILTHIHHHEDEGRDSLWGIGFSLFNAGYRALSNDLHLKHQKFLQRSISYAHFNFPELALGSDKEFTFNLGRLLRNIAYNDQEPIIRLPGNDPISDNDLENLKNVEKIYLKETAEFIHGRIKTLNQIFAEQSEFLGSESERVQSGVYLLEDLVHGFDGDFVSTMFHAMPFDNNIDHSELNKRKYGLSKYGYGIFASDGFIQRLGNIIENSPGDKKQLIENIDRYAKRLFRLRNLQSDLARHEEREKKIIEEEPDFRARHERIGREVLGDKQSTNTKIKEILDKLPFGRQVFFDWLFNLVGADPKEAAKLLQPSCCTESEWEKAISSYDIIERLSQLDERFEDLGEPIPEAELNNVRSIVSAIESPMTLKGIGQLYFDRYEEFYPELKRAIKVLTKRGIISKIGSGNKVICSIYYQPSYKFRFSIRDSRAFFIEQLTKELRNPLQKDFEYNDINEYWEYLKEKYQIPRDTLIEIINDMQNNYIQINELIEKRKKEITAEKQRYVI